jgi:hypothetical protein
MIINIKIMHILLLIKRNISISYKNLVKIKGFIIFFFFKFLFKNNLSFKKKIFNFLLLC